MLERWNDDKMDTLDAKVGRLDTRLTRVEVKVDEIDTRLTRVEVKVDEDFKEVRAGLAEQRGEFSALQRTLVMATVGILGIFITGFGILVGLIVGM